MENIDFDFQSVYPNDEPNIEGTIIIDNKWIEYNGGFYRIDVKVSRHDKSLKWWTPAILSLDKEKIILLSRDLETRGEAVKLARHAIDKRKAGDEAFKDDYLYSFGTQLKGTDFEEEI